MGARSLPESMKVAKLVMSSTRPDRSRLYSWTIRRKISPSISRRSWAEIRSIARQKCPWPAASAGNCVQRGPAVLSHQSAKASFEQGATTRLATASEI
jgi:hypothetical protein